MKRTNIAHLLMLLILYGIPAYAENGMNSPYTRFGYGQLATYDMGFSKAMGGTGIALRNSNQINMHNPASYSSVDTLTFIMDMGATLQNTNFAENGVRRNARNATFDYFTMQYRLRKGLGMTVGFTPFSNVGYEYSSAVKTIRNDEDGIVTASNKCTGEGGLGRVTAGLGWQPFKGLSIGANASYIYGNFSHYVYNDYSETSISTRTKQYTADVKGLSFDMGAQVYFGWGKSQFIAGATYTLGSKLQGDPYSVDYIITNKVATSADTLWYAPFTLPESFGGGLAYRYDERITVAADFSLQRYGTASFFEAPGSDRYRASLGMEYIPENYARKFFRRLRYRAGVHYATSYFTVNGQEGPDEYGASIGVGIPIINGYNQRSTVNVSGQFIHVQPRTPGMITENYMQLSIGVSFIENWFAKWKVN